MYEGEATMIVRDIMKQAVISISPQATVLEAAKLIIEKRIGTLPVVDGANVLIGVVKISDILDIFIPNYFDLIESLRFVHDFGALEDFLPKDVPEADNIAVETLMEPPVFVGAGEWILRAGTSMSRHEWMELAVVDLQRSGVGLASLLDVGAAVGPNWGGGRGW
jgi:CBS domain-containing protein